MFSANRLRASTGRSTASSSGRPSTQVMVSRRPVESASTGSGTVTPASPASIAP